MFGGAKTREEDQSESYADSYEEEETGADLEEMTASAPVDSLDEVTGKRSQDSRLNEWINESITISSPFYIMIA